MATTTRGTRLTELHRIEQLSLRARFLREFLRIWGVLDPARLDRTVEAWLPAAVSLVEENRARSGQAAVAYYEAFRRAETTARPVLEPRSAPVTRRERAAITASLVVTGPVEIKKRAALGIGAQAAAKSALVAVSGAAGRHVLAGGRDVLVEAGTREERAKRAYGFARVTDGDPCWFCALVASRGYVYRSRDTAGGDTNARFVGEGMFKFHDHCGCTVEPSFQLNASVPGRGEEFAQLWVDSTRGLSGHRARTAFRRALEGHSLPDDPIGLAA